MSAMVMAETAWTAGLAAQRVLAQPSGQVRQNAEQAGGGAADIGQAIADFLSDWARGQYGWLLGLIVLFLVARFAWRLVKG